mgnify:CR=1 FL=1
MNAREYKVEEVFPLPGRTDMFVSLDLSVDDSPSEFVNLQTGGIWRITAYPHVPAERAARAFCMCCIRGSNVLDVGHSLCARQ